MILEFARKIEFLTGTGVGIAFTPLPEDDPRQRQPDVSLAMRKLQWQPRTDLETGLVKTIEYFRSNSKITGNSLSPQRDLQNAFAQKTVSA